MLNIIIIWVTIGIVISILNFIYLKRKNKSFLWRKHGLCTIIIWPFLLVAFIFCIPAIFIYDIDLKSIIEKSENKG
jgi:hypothetical protein